jgi:hypothetical protein
MHSHHFRAPIVLASATAVAAMLQCAQAQSESEVKRVNLVVSELTAQKKSKGLLYRSFATSRKHVADVNEDGSLDRSVTCKTGEKFEAKADSSFDRPVAPIQVVCNAQMTFAFTRMFYITFPADQVIPSMNPTEQPHIYANYADVFAKSGKPVAAGAWTEASVLAVAAELGDKTFDRYVYRDVADGFKLKFSTEGTAALRIKQRALGVPETGNLDAATTSAIARTTPGSNSTPALRCDRKSGPATMQSPFLCSQIADNEVPRVTNSNNTTVLPKLFIRG